MRGRQYLRMVDGTLENPFFSRRANGQMVHVYDDEEDPEGITQCVDLGTAAGGKEIVEVR